MDDSPNALHVHGNKHPGSSLLAGLSGACKQDDGNNGKHSLHDRLLSRNQDSPTISPSSVTSTFSADGTVGSPGMVMISPQYTTTNPAPALRETSVTISVKPRGLPSASSSSDSEYWVLAMQTGSVQTPRPPAPRHRSRPRAPFFPGRARRTWRPLQRCHRETC